MLLVLHLWDNWEMNATVRVESFTSLKEKDKKRLFATHFKQHRCKKIIKRNFGPFFLILRLRKQKSIQIRFKIKSRLNGFYSKVKNFSHFCLFLSNLKIIYQLKKLFYWCYRMWMEWIKFNYLEATQKLSNLFVTKGYNQ